MNSIIINPKEVEYLEEEGISFSNKTFIEILIDKFHYNKFDAFQDGVVYFPELKRSTEKTGKYLIFTSICGIADDAGWDRINVDHSGKEIFWEIERNGYHKFIFDRIEYIEQVNKCEKQLKLSEFPFAIKHVVFPE